jgi:predicted DCC family thiol-disulfide oxidoreductase YuxK
VRLAKWLGIEAAIVGVALWGAVRMLRFATQSHSLVARDETSGAPVASPRLLLFYDADCRFCRWAISVVLRWDSPRVFGVGALDGELAEVILGHLIEDDRFGSWHVMDIHGHVTSRGEAVSGVLAEVRFGTRLAAISKRFPWLLDTLYERVKRQRGRLSRLVTDGADARARRLLESRTTHEVGFAGRRCR